jgi:pSer/pThr/pTyr-binding forkhead associated (FHA) protein
MTLNTTSTNALEMAKHVNLQEGAISIGRAEDNDLHIQDKTVSAHHARIFTYLDASYIEDLGSKNGTYLNGKRIQKHTLHIGDVIKVGRLEFKITKDN